MLQTVLGAGGQIANELALELNRSGAAIRLVSRHPRKVNADDQLVSADLTDAAATKEAVAGSETVYLTAGLPMNSSLWEQVFPRMMQNTIAACEKHDAKLVFFDNTYMYPQTSTPQTESTAFAPNGRKGKVRAQITSTLLKHMRAGGIEAAICRAPEFYGPGRTQSLSNSMVFTRMAQHRRAFIPVSSQTKRTLIWTPDASRAMALIGRTPDAFSRTWHLPCDSSRLTYREMVALAAEETGRHVAATTVPEWMLRSGGLVNSQLREASELLPRYRCDNIFESTKFTTRFPDFRMTTYREGIRTLLNDRG